MKSSFFKSNLSDLQPVAKGEKGSGEGGGKSDGWHVIPDDNDSDSDSDSDSDDQSDPGDLPELNIDGNPHPMVDVIPEGSSLEEMFGPDAEVLDGSDQQNDTPKDAKELKKAAEQADKNAKIEQASESGGAPGSGVGGRRVVHPDLFPVKTDWAGILINLLKTTVKGPPSWAKIPPKTFGMKVGGTRIVRPGRTEKVEIGKIALAIDTSGSISTKMLTGFLSDTKRIFTTFVGSSSFAVTVLLWSDGPYAISKEFKINEFEPLKKWVMENVHSGGTSISRVIDAINNIRTIRDYVATVWFTDGEIWDLDKPLPNMDNIIVIQGYQSESTRTFMRAVDKYRPKGKKITLVRTNY